MWSYVDTKCVLNFALKFGLVNMKHLPNSSMFHPAKLSCCTVIANSNYYMVNL